MTHAEWLNPVDFNFYDVVEAKIEALTAAGRRVVYAPDFSVTGQYALYRNHARCGADSPFSLIGVPSTMMEHARKAVAEHGTVDDYTHAMSLEEVSALGRIAGLFDPYGFWDVKNSDQGKHLPDLARHSGLGPHSEEVTRLESDRDFGKQVAHFAGLRIPKYCVVKTLDDLAKLDALGVDRLYLKHDKRSIGAFSLTGAKEAMPALLTKGQVVAEEFIGKTTREVSFCFVIVGENVQPMCVMQESSRLLDNDSGGKVGSSAAFHDGSWDGPHAQSFERVTRCMQAAAKQVQGFNGWVDVSFCIDERGEWYFTEWMCRCGIPNINAHLHHLNVSYLDLLDNVGQGNFYTLDELWRTHYNYGLTLFNLPLDAHMDSIEQIVPLNPELCDPDNDVIFDPYGGPASLFNGRELFVPNLHVPIGLLSVNSNRQLDPGDVFPPSVQGRLQTYLDELHGQIPALAWRSFKV